MVKFGRLLTGCALTLALLLSGGRSNVYSQDSPPIQAVDFTCESARSNVPFSCYGQKIPDNTEATLTWYVWNKPPLEGDVITVTLSTGNYPIVLVGIDKYGNVVTTQKQIKVEPHQIYLPIVSSR